MSETPSLFDADLQGSGPRAIASALPDALLSLAFLLTWVAPGRMPAGMPHFALLTFLLEFIVVHSAGFMGQQIVTPGPASRRALAIVGLGGFYSMFVGGFALAFHSWWPLGSFWLLTLNRLSTVIARRAPDDHEREHLQLEWAGNAMAYLGAVFATLLLPLPALGLTPDRVAALHLPGRGIWIDQPWRVLAAAALYFGVVAWLELRDYRPLQRRPAAPGSPPAAT